ncbi:MAG: nicotinamide-nucleotide adenylyltransferase [Candidatus Altiarchaeota archaeon]
MTKALVIGRFQPFHIGHLSGIEFVLNRVDKVIIGIGSSQESNTRENPFSADERKSMIERSLDYDNSRYDIVYIPDINDDVRWVGHVRKIVPEFDHVYTNGENEMRLFKDAGCDIKNIPFYNKSTYNATNIRERMRVGRPWKHLVPQGTAKTIDEVDGARRVKELG